MAHLPVAAWFLPRRSLTGLLARFAFWPLAYVAARTRGARDVILVAGVLILGSLLASTAVHRRSRLVVRAGAALAALVAGAASFAAAHATRFGSGSLALVVAAVIAVAAGLSFARALLAARPHPEPSLDADALALAPAATWMTLCALLTGFGAEATHAHVLVPAFARGTGALAVLLGALALATLARQHRWTRRVYRGEARPLMIAASGAGPALSHVEGADAAIVVGPATAAPYRDHRPVVARVPADEAVLARRYGALARDAALAFGLALAAFAAGARAEVAHGAAATASKRLPPLDGVCASAPPSLRLVPLTPLRVLDIEEIAAHYRRSGIATRVEPPMPFEERFFDAERAQVIAEEILAAAMSRRHVHDTIRTDELVLVVTDRDMHLRETGWRFAFAGRRQGVAVVSLARMDPSFPWPAPAHYARTRPRCTVELEARAFKMITRQLLLELCQAQAVLDPRSARRPSVLGLGDLDEMEEDRY